MLNQFQGIEGLSPRQPVGAHLTVGTKGPRGFPVDRNLLYFKLPKQADGIKAQHPGFDLWHSKATESQRQVIHGNLVHASEGECFEHFLKNHKGPKGDNPPGQMPFCTGDGKGAKRWVEGEFKTIVCAGSICEYRQGTVKACKPWARLYFMPSWKDGSPNPSPLTKLTTGSWNTVANFKGFFEYIESQAKLCGIHEPNLFGLPFTLTLTKQTSAKAKTAFPVITITPSMSLVEFFRTQRLALEAAGATGYPILVGARSDEELDPEVVAADHAEINPGIPSSLPVVD